MYRMLITGGKGFIGTNLTQELRRRGHSVWTADIAHGVDEKHFRADVGEYGQMDSILRKREFDYVFHLAAEYGRWNGEDHYENLWRTNVIGTKHMLRLQERYGFRMIFFSSAEVYGDFDGIMREDVMDRIAIKQMNDYAMTKWVGEMQCVNSADMFGTQTVRVRPVNCYGPNEYYSPYRGVIPIFVYNCLKGQSFRVHKGHKRIFDYVEDTCRTVGNIVDNFVAGEVYNVGGKEEWAIDIEELAELVLKETGAAASLADYRRGEEFTTRVKLVDFRKARRDLKHEPQVDINEGIRLYVEWMKRVYSW